MVFWNEEARAWIVRNLLEKDGLFRLSKEEIDSICSLTEGIWLISFGVKLKKFLHDIVTGNSKWFLFEILLLWDFLIGYSGSDMKNLVKDASMGPLREALRQGTEITTLKKEDMRPVTLQVITEGMHKLQPQNKLCSFYQFI